MCDLSKAFDTVSHDILRTKLAAYGFKGAAFRMLSTYLQNRKQFVVVNSSKSNTRSIDSGVPQGSILGPILFNIYVNELPSQLNCHTTLYADDTTLLFIEEDHLKLENEVNKTMKICEDWFTKNTLYLNKNKTQQIAFSMDRWKPAGEPVKLLGVYLDPRLNYKTHVEHLCSKLSKATYAIKRIYKTAGSEAAATAYFALHHSLLSYAIEVWGHTPHIHMVLKEQKKAVRSIEGRVSTEHCKPFFRKYNILTVTAEYTYRVLTEIHKHTKDELNTGGDFHGHDTRSKNLLRPPAIRLHTSEYLRRGIVMYNQCPQSWKEEMSIFAQALRKYLLSLAPYTREEINFAM